MAMVLDLFVQKALGKLAEIGEQEACRVLGVKEEIKKFRRRLMRISSFLEDAERKRHTDAAISTWVKELKDIMYDADDIIDLCMFGGGKLLEPQHPSSSSINFPLSLLSSCFSCVKHRHEIAIRIEELNGRLKEIAEDNQVIPRLVESITQGSQGSVVSSRATSPIQVDSDIVGRQIENAANDVINWILEDDRKQCQVYGIVGMGGIGKTTLARKIFNHQTIKDNFPTRIWLYISKNYSETGLLKEFIRASTEGNNDGSGESIAELGTKLVNILQSKDKKILLVLDDLWSAEVWNNLLRTHVVSSKVKSRILITSRDVNIGRAMGATNNHIHHVEKINEEDGWELLRTIIFKDEDESIISVLKDVGIRIVATCDGLPLAIKVVAGILFCKEKSRREWEKVLENDVWRMNLNDEIPRALYLSYEDLPYELKPCFLSCALFRGSTDSECLVALWMAEGFIAEQQNMLMEELGEDYYRELVSRNLLQLDPIYADDSGFVMHDLLRSLATSLMEEGISLSEGETLNSNNLLIKIRRLSMSNKRDILTLPNTIIEQNCLRVLVVYSSHGTKTMEDDTLKILRRLRVLDLSNTSICSIPNSIGELLHMRCLYLDSTNICELPEYVGNLLNLQTLSIRGCRSLYRLPNSITRLCNLRCLLLFETPLTHLPKGIGKLTNINYLDGFVVGCDDSASSDHWCDLEDLQYLSNLRRLDMRSLERASIKEGATVLANQIFLRCLYINWTILREDKINEAPSTSDKEEIIKRAESVCRQFIPPSSLEDFQIHNFPVERFPDWIMSTSLGASFPHLAYLTLNSLQLCTVLPPLGQLPQLKYLVIKRALGITKIGPGFLGGHVFSEFPAFPKLDYLHFEDMPNWEEWELCTEQEEEKVGDKKNHLKLFPNLTRCELIGCSRLIALPEAFYHSTNMKQFGIEGCVRLERISSVPPLKYLSIEDCSSLEHVENVEMPQNLHLKCPLTDNELLPQWLLDLLTNYNPHSHHSLKEFRMQCGLPLLKSCLKEKPNWHIIQQIPNVFIRAINNELRMEYTKDPPFYNVTVAVDSDSESE